MRKSDRRSMLQADDDAHAPLSAARAAQRSGSRARPDHPGHAARPRRPRLRVVPAVRRLHNEDIRAAIHSGLTITFVYDVELRRGTAVWLDRTLASATVSASVRYDNLARRYHVTLSADGRTRGLAHLDREEPRARVADRVRQAPISSAPRRLEPNAEYYLRVRAHTMPRNASFVWPWEGPTSPGSPSSRSSAEARRRRAMPRDPAGHATFPAMPMATTSA